MGGGADDTWDPDATVVPGGATVQLGDDATVVPSDATVAPDGAPLPPRAAPSEVLLVGRYRLGPLIGRGGVGQVHRAHDVLMDEQVAIKFVRALGPGALRQLRRELTALRVLAVPGVVRLHDDGEDQGQTFLVMDLLSGGTFDRLAERGDWHTWSHEARALLETLARVHFAGVFHLDLKPGNILLDADENPVITDFGLAQGRSVEDPGAHHREGTPRYMAPEQRTGQPCDARTDLYALGGMLWEMLTGEVLPAEPEARSLAEVGLPAEVREAVTAMLADDPADRPGSAVELITRLFGDAPAVLGPSDLGLPEVARAAQLQALFDEPQPSFLHLAEDAAEVLLERTGGAREAVQAELDRWVRAGLVWWNDGRVHIERPAIEQLRWERDPVREQLVGLLTAGQSEAFVDAAIAFATTQDRSGSMEKAFAVLEAALPVARECGRSAEVVQHLAVGATDLLQGLDRTLHYATREQAHAAAALTRAAQAQQNGRWDQVLAHTQSALAVPRPILEPACLAFRTRALGATDRQAQVAWLGRAPEESRLSATTWHTAKGHQAYALGDYRAALGHHLAVCGATHKQGAQLAALTNAAAAALELPDPGQALEIAARAEQLLRTRRLPLVEARLHWLLRTARYRRGDRLHPHEEWVDAAERVSPNLAGQLAATEAAIAWREGHPEAAGLAGRAKELFHRRGFSAGETLVATLQVAAGTPSTPSLLSDAHTLPLAELALQALALLRLGGVPVTDWKRLLPGLEAERPREQWRHRLDVLSVDEALAALAAPTG